MNYFTSTLVVNRLLTSIITLSVSLFAGNTFAYNNQPSINTHTIISSGIEFASLHATATDKAVFIDWVTASEQNNSHFEVERSLDMKVFTTVAIVLDGFETASTGKSYKFKEAAGKVKNGKTVYYRLKQIDNNNQVHYSTVMAVKINSAVSVLPKSDITTLTTNSNTTAIAFVEYVHPNGQILLSKQSVL